MSMIKKTTILLWIVTTTALACMATDSTSVLKPGEFLFVELHVDGNTIFRNYKEDGYIDIIITPDYDVNGYIHLYNTVGVSNLQVFFNAEGVTNNPVLRLPDIKNEFVFGSIKFGMMDRKEFLEASKRFKEFTMMLTYTKNGKVHGNDITIGE